MLILSHTFCHYLLESPDTSDSIIFPLCHVYSSVRNTLYGLSCEAEKEEIILTCRSNLVLDVLISFAKSLHNCKAQEEQKTTRKRKHLSSTLEEPCLLSYI